MMPATKTFLAILESKDRQLADCFGKIETTALDNWIHLLREDKGSHAGYVHLRNVQRTADKMVPERVKQEFTAGEIFLLLSAILLHDIGRLVPDDAPREVRCPRTEWKHGCGSKRLIDEQWASLGLPDSHIAGYCALLAYTHCLDRPPAPGSCCLQKPGCPLGGIGITGYANQSLEPYGKLRIGALAAILRIADETENHWTRAVSDIAYDLYRRSGRPLGKAFRRHIEDIEFWREGMCVVIHLGGSAAEAQSGTVLDSLGTTRENIRTVVEAWGDELEPMGLSFRRVLFERAGLLYTNPFHAYAAPEGDLAVEWRCADVFSKREAGRKKEAGRLLGILESIRKLSAGTRGFEPFRLSAVDAELAAPLSRDETAMLHCLTRLGGGLKIAPGPDGVPMVEVDLEALDQTKARIEKEEKRKTDKGPPADSSRDVAGAILRIWRGTRKYSEIGWGQVEASMGRSLNHDDRHAAAEGLKSHRLRLVASPSGTSFSIQQQEKARLPEKTNDLVEKMYNGTRHYEPVTWGEIEARLGMQLTYDDRAALKKKLSGRFDLKPVGSRVRIVATKGSRRRQDRSEERNDAS